jgi:hypothetical protein
MVANSARDAASFADGTIVVRANSAYYPPRPAARSARVARFSVAMKMDPKIAAIG